MKLFKAFSLPFAATLVAALAMVASSASATGLCRNAPIGDACNSAYAPGTLLDANAKEARFETAVGSVTCQSFFEDEVSKPPTPKGVTAQSFVLEMIFFGCTLGGSKCTVSAVHMTYRGVFSWTSGGDGTMELTEDSFNGPPGVSIVCGASISCTYSFQSPLDVKGASQEATIVASKDTLGNASGKNCPGAGSPIVWFATYTLLDPENGKLFLANYAPSVALCKKNETPCPLSERYAAPAFLTANLETGVKAKLRLTISEEGEETEYTVPCESSVFKGSTTETVAWPLPGEVNALTFSECGGTCSATALAIPYATQIEASGAGNGTIEMMAGGGGAPPRLRVKCIGAYKCTYEASSVSTSVTGGMPAKLAVNAVLGTLVAAESEEKCGPELRWEGKYEFTEPLAGGVAKMWIVREGA
jgi:hypothetical protein